MHNEHLADLDDITELEFSSTRLSIAFVGIILLPLIERVSESIIIVHEAWEGHINFSLSHVLGASMQVISFFAFDIEPCTNCFRLLCVTQR